MVAAAPEGSAPSPVWAHCGACANEWVVAWQPITVELFAAVVVKNSTCDACGSRSALLGKSPADQVEVPRG